MFHKILTLPLLIAFSISATISFDIDMSDYQFPNNDYNSVVINGSWNNWSGWGVTLNDDDEDQIFSGELNLDSGTYEYVIALTGAADSWSGWGQVINAPLGSVCDYDSSDSWANYGFTVSADSNIQQSYCAGDCEETCSDSGDGGGNNGGEYTLVWSDEFNDNEIDQSKWNFVWVVVVGIIVGQVIGTATEYYTAYEYRPTKKLSEQAVTGPATVIIGGMGLGMISTAIPTISPSPTIEPEPLDFK